MLGELIAVVGLAGALIVVGTALFGSQTLSERAFRLLRWTGNRPDPAAPLATEPGNQEPSDPPGTEIRDMTEEPGLARPRLEGGGRMFW